MKRMICFILMLCFAVSANAVTIVQVEGVVTSIEERGGYSFDDSVQVGTTFTETYYFSDLTDSSSDPEIGDYAADYSVASIGNYVFISCEVGLNVDCGGIYHHYLGRATSLETDGVIYVDSVPYEYNSIDWIYNQSSFYLFSSLGIPDSDEFPDSFPDLSVFDWENSWSVGGFVETNAPLLDGVAAKGEITSISVIPEPCTILLFGLGGFGVIRWRQ